MDKKIKFNTKAVHKGQKPEELYGSVSLPIYQTSTFKQNKIAKVMDKMGIKEGEVITHSMVTKSIERAQKKVEARNFSIRKHLLEYDDVMNSQRELVYERRNFALHNNDISKLFSNITAEYINETIQYHTNETNNLKECDWDELSVDILDIFGLDISSLESSLNEPEKLIDHINEQSKEILDYKNNKL
jgi:preprotein translocase subunit SecA